MVSGIACLLAVYVALCVGIILGAISILPHNKEGTPSTHHQRCQDGKVYRYENGVINCVAICPNFKG